MIIPSNISFVVFSSLLAADFLSSEGICVTGVKIFLFFLFLLALCTSVKLSSELQLLSIIGHLFARLIEVESISISI